MKIKTKSQVKTDAVTIPKGTEGIVIACQFGGGNYDYLVNFPKAKYVKCSIESVEIL